MLKINFFINTILFNLLKIKNQFRAALPFYLQISSHIHTELKSFHYQDNN